MIFRRGGLSLTDDDYVERAEQAEQAEQQLAIGRQRRALRRKARALRLQRIGLAIAGGWGFVMRDLCGLAGMALVAYGAWLTYPPAGYIIGGALLLAAAWISASREP